MATGIGNHGDDVAASGARFQLGHAHGSAGDGGRRKTADAEVVGVGRFDAFVDAVADTHALSLERPRRRMSAAGDNFAPFVAAAATAADAGQITDETDAALVEWRRGDVGVDS